MFHIWIFQELFGAHSSFFVIGICRLLVVDNNLNNLATIQYIMNNKFKERLHSLMLKNESIRAFASRCGLSDSTIRHYFAETSEPTLGKIEMIAKTCNVSVGWLAAGEEKDVVLDRALLKQIAQLIEDRLDEKKASLSTAKKMELICILYEEILRDASLRDQLPQKTHTLLNLLAA
jgi:transcriptional regulator with XRE-family HTH domain